MHNVDKDILKSILNQIAGNARKNEELLPEVAIKGSGYIWCYDLIQKNMVRVVCESKCYILDATKALFPVTRQFSCIGHLPWIEATGHIVCIFERWQKPRTGLPLKLS